MIFDKQLMMSEAQNPTTVAAHASTNVIDLDKAGLDAGNSDIEVFVRVETAVTSAGDATVQFKLETSDAEAFGSGVVTLMDSGALAKTALVANYQPFKIKLPYGCKRYLRMTYTIGTAVLTAGAFDAGLILNRQTNHA